MHKGTNRHIPLPQYDVTFYLKKGERAGGRELIPACRLLRGTAKILFAVLQYRDAVLPSDLQLCGDPF